MKISTLLIMGLVFIVASAIIAPPDPISEIMVLFEMVIVCGFLSFIISRFKSLKRTPEAIKKLIIIMVCLLSITISYSITLFQYCY
jgi:Sec-independent protein secretion pathway component TatC